MSVPYEKIVIEDINVGIGTVSVTMPGGGSATGNKVGIQSFPAIAFTGARSSNQSIGTGSTFITVQLDTEELDTNSWYDPTTYAFTALKAGIYIVTAEITLAAFTGTLTAAIYKNSAAAATTEAIRAAVAATITLSGMVSLNGSSDTVTLRVKHSDSSSRNVTSARLAGAMLGKV